MYIIDEYDKKYTTRNYLLKIDNIYVATVRFIEVDKNIIKLQRLVVPRQYRKNGYASMILNYLEKDARSLDYKKVIMDSAYKAEGFYEKNGYIRTSKMFYENGGPHVKMKKELLK